MPFCESCGNKVSESAKFCKSCGAPVNLPSNKNLGTDKAGTSEVPLESSNSENNETQNSDNGKTQQLKKDFKGCLKSVLNGFLVLVGLFVILMVIGYFFIPDYPESKEKFSELYCGKCWHLTDFDIQELHVNGKTIHLGKSNRDKLMGMLGDKNFADEQRFLQTLNNGLQKIVNDQRCFQIAKVDVKDSSIISYEQHFSDSFNEYVYETSIPKFSRSNGKFIFVEDGTKYTYSVASGERLDISSSSRETDTVESITDKSLEILARLEVKGEDNFVIVLKLDYEPIKPNGKTRYESEFALWEQH